MWLKSVGGKEAKTKKCKWQSLIKKKTSSKSRTEWKAMSSNVSTVVAIIHNVRHAEKKGGLQINLTTNNVVATIKSSMNIIQLCKRVSGCCQLPWTVSAAPQRGREEQGGKSDLIQLLFKNHSVFISSKSRPAVAADDPYQDPASPTSRHLTWVTCTYSLQHRLISTHPASVPFHLLFNPKDKDCCAFLVNSQSLGAVPEITRPTWLTGFPLRMSSRSCAAGCFYYNKEVKLHF